MSALTPGTICLLQVETKNSEEWQTLRAFDNLKQAQDLALTLQNNGINSSIACACGSYDYGECEPCSANACDWCGGKLDNRIVRDGSAYCSKRCASCMADNITDDRVRQALGMPNASEAD